MKSPVELVREIRKILRERGGARGVMLDPLGRVCPIGAYALAVYGKVPRGFDEETERLYTEAGEFLRPELERMRMRLEPEYSRYSHISNAVWLVNDELGLPAVFEMLDLAEKRLKEAT